MESDPRQWLSGLQRPWTEVATCVARDRARRFRDAGAADQSVALWASECELRQSLGYARSRELDLRHHIDTRNQLDQLASQSAR